MERNVPEYVSRSVPVPLTGRVPWYKSTFPSYFGIFLFVGYYLKLAGPTIGYASPTVVLWGLVVAGLLCFGLYYYVPAMLGMQTGRTLYVVGTSTFRNHGWISDPGNTDGPVAGWLGGGGRRDCHQLHHEGPGPDIEDALQRDRAGVALQPGVGGDQGNPLRRPGGQDPELGSVPDDADRAVGQPERYPPLPASAQ